MTKRLSMGALMVAVAVLFTAMSATAVPKTGREWRGKENPAHAKGMPLFFRSQAGTTWINVNDSDCSAADTENSTHSPAQVWCFEGANGDSITGGVWQSWSKFDPPLPGGSKWHLNSDYTITGSGVMAWVGCDNPTEVIDINTECGETAFWDDPTNLEGYGDDWNYSLVLNIDNADHTLGGTIEFDVRYDVECNYDYFYLEYLSGFTVVGSDTVFEWSEIVTFNGVSTIDGPTVCGGDHFGYSDRDSSGALQHTNAQWVPGGYSGAIPTTGGTSTTNTRIRWRGFTDGAWSDRDYAGTPNDRDTKGIGMIDNVTVTFNDGSVVGTETFGTTQGMVFPAPPTTNCTAQWQVPGIEGNTYNAWRVAFDPDYKNRGNTCEFTDDWMFTTRIPVLGAYTNEARYDYYLVSPVIDCTGWTGGVMEYANYLCCPEGSATTGDRNDFTNTLIRVHDTTGVWSLWNDFDGYIIFGGCEFWNMNETEDLTPYLGGDIDSLQLGYEMLDLSQPGDFVWGKHKNTSWQIDRVSIGSFDGAATTFGTSAIRIFADTFSLTDPAHTAQLDNDEQGNWDGNGGTYTFAADDALNIDVHDPDGLSGMDVDLYYRVGTGTPPVFGAWQTKPMTLGLQDNLGDPGEGRYDAMLGNTTSEDFNPGVEGSPDHIWEAGQTIRYYITAVDDIGDTAYFPADSDIDSTAHFRFQILPFNREINGAGQKILLVDDYTRNDLDFENSTGWVANGGAGFGSFTDAEFDQPEDMVERALILLAGGDEDGTEPPIDGGPKWDIYNVFGGGSSVTCEPRIIESQATGLGGIVSALGQPRYDAVIWLQGTFDNYSYADSTADDLPSYLNNGGHFLGFGSEVVEWATGDVGTTEVSTFFKQYLGTQYAGAQAGWRICNFTGRTGTELEGLKFGLYGECNGIRKSYDQLQLSVLVPPTNLALADYTDSNDPGNPVSGIAVIANLNNSQGWGVQTGFDIGSMLSDESRACFIGSILSSRFGITGLDSTICGGANDGVGVDVGASRFGFELAAAAPNPFSNATSIRFSVANRTHVSIEVYNILGQKVRTLVNEVREPDSYVEVWDGRADAGTQVSSGIYFYKMVAGEFSATKKAVLLK